MKKIEDELDNIRQDTYNMLCLMRRLREDQTRLIALLKELIDEKKELEKHRREDLLHAYCRGD